jgi:hypothetical protein
MGEFKVLKDINDQSGSEAEDAQDSNGDCDQDK